MSSHVIKREGFFKYAIYYPDGKNLMFYKRFSLPIFAEWYARKYIRENLVMMNHIRGLKK